MVIYELEGLYQFLFWGPFNIRAKYFLARSQGKFSSIFLKSLKDFIWFVRPILYGGSRSRHRADMLLWGHTLRRRLVGSTLCQAYRGALSRSAIATASISSRYKKKLRFSFSSDIQIDEFCLPWFKMFADRWR